MQGTEQSDRPAHELSCALLCVVQRLDEDVRIGSQIAAPSASPAL
jgi:hypothetical protein